MKPGTLHPIAATITAGALAWGLTGCTGEPEAKSTPTPKPPTLTEATRTLAQDGQEIARLMEVGAESIDDRTKEGAPRGCSSGGASRQFTATIEASIKRDVRSDLASMSAFTDTQIEDQGYQRIKYSEMPDGLDVVFTTVWRKAPPGVTFTVTTWAKSPQESVTRIAGRTDCLQ